MRFLPIPRTIRPDVSLSSALLPHPVSETDPAGALFGAPSGQSPGLCDNAASARLVPPRGSDVLGYGLTCLVGVATLLTAVQASAQQTVSAPEPTKANAISEVTVTAPRLDLLGTASTASEGHVDDEELQLTPTYRPGQLLETVPGLTVTSHSGEGKANQYLMRGYNLDHGTELETYVDGMPINQPTHAHGQGYTDLSFMIPELADQIDYKKGPYYANVGDFGAVGSAHIRYRDEIENQVTTTVGTYNFERLFTAGTQNLGQGKFLAAVEMQHYDGPFQVPDDARKENVVFRYSQNGGDNGFSVTSMFYHQDWTNTTDIPIRAISSGLVPDRFGSLAPTDGGHAMRASLSANYHDDAMGPGKFQASAFYIYNRLNLINNFTHYLVDPVNGDQENQFETRHVIGGQASYTLPAKVLGFDNEFQFGALTRADFLDVGRMPSAGQTPLSPAQYANDPVSFINHDQVTLFSGALYQQATTHWSDQWRTVLGLREDYQHGTDTDLLPALHSTAGYTNSGARGQVMLQPKGSLIFAPNDVLEFYGSVGEGFHSADLRGVDQSRNPSYGPQSSLLAEQWGEEIGMRSTLSKRATFTVAFYNLWQSSQTTLNPDVGQDTEGPPSDRYGFEVNATYEFTNWLELYSSFSGNHSRFMRPYDDGSGHSGTQIPNAPPFTGNLSLYLKNLGPWSGGLTYRFMSDYPITSGPCVDSAARNDFPSATSCRDAPTAQNTVWGKGYGELNLDVNYTFPQDWVASVGIYNLLNTNAPAAEFYYVDRLKNEIAAYPDGRADIHQHPLEGLTARVTISRRL